MRKIFNLLYSYSATVILLLLYALLLALATFIEAKMGTPKAKELVYHNPLFIFMQLVMIVNFIGVAIRVGLVRQRKWGLLVSHMGFVVALVGAMVTHIFGSEAMLHIREGYSNNIAYGDRTELNYMIEYDGERDRYSQLLSSGDRLDVEHKGVNIALSNYCKGCGVQGSDVVALTISSGGESKEMMLQGTPLSPGESSSIEINGRVVTANFGAEIVTLPFTVALNDFVLKRYGGSGSPSSYESYVTIDMDGKKENHHIYMNNIAYVGSYRLYQTSFDQDEMGTLLTVNDDLLGMVISYSGYLMMLLGFIVAIAHRSSRFRTLLRRLKYITTTAAMLLMVSNIYAISYTPVGAMKMATMPSELAEKMARLHVQNPSGRIEPLGSYADKLITKITRSSSFEGIGSVQMLASMVADPYLWSCGQIIYISNKDIKALFGHRGYIAYNDLFEMDGSYKLTPYLEKIYAKKASEQSRMDKDILKLDEKINIMNMLFNGRMLPLFPKRDSEDGHWFSKGDDLSSFESRDSMFVANIVYYLSEQSQESVISGDWQQPMEIISMIDTYQQKMASPSELIPEKKISAELFYNKVNIFKISGITYLAAGSVLLLVLLLSMLGKPRPYAKYITYITITLIVAAFLYHTFGIGLRWYISGRSPWTNAYESMISVSWSAVLAALVFGRRSTASLGVATMMGGIVAMISMLSFLDPEITPLVPVLKSYWLLFHVAIITTSYGFFGVSALLGLVSMFMITFAGGNRQIKSKVEEMTIINELSMIIGVILLTIGVFLGAIWANESWGRYWGWDPKETWALISMVVYAFILHCRYVPSLRGEFFFIAMSVYGFYSILMTFFGVNYYLTGMHSYSEGSSLSGGPIIYATLSVVLLTVVSHYKYKSLK